MTHLCRQEVIDLETGEVRVEVRDLSRFQLIKEPGTVPCINGIDLVPPGPELNHRRKLCAINPKLAWLLTTQVRVIGPEEIL